MKNKLFLPGMAMVVAIGMSFATERSTADPDNDYVWTENGLRIIDEVPDCGIRTITCMAEDESGNKYPIFDSIEDQEPKVGGAIIPL